MNALIASVALLLAVASVLSVATLVFTPFLLGAFVLAVTDSISDDHRHATEQRP